LAVMGSQRGAPVSGRCWNLGDLPPAASGGQRNVGSLAVGMLDVEIDVCQVDLIRRAETTPEGSYS
jgi:hypothetical protein